MNGFSVNRDHFRLSSLFLGLMTSAALFLLSGCTGATGFSGATTALPTGQTGSVSILSAAPANCYVSGKSSACSPTGATTGTNGITAIATVSYNSSTSNALFWGDSAGNIYDTSVSTAAAPASINPCVSAAGGSIGSIAVYPGPSTPGTLFYSTSTGVSYSTVSSITSCGGAHTTSIATSSLLAYNSSSTIIVGATTTGSYFTCTSAGTCSSPQSLLKLPQGATITGIASDPQYSVVYITTNANGNYAINYYSIASSGTSYTLHYIGNYMASELSAPVGIALFQGPNPTQQFCTSGSCNFLDVVNAGNDSITQYVLTYTLSGTVPTSISINQFNSAYIGCDLFDASSIAAIAKPTSGLPAVFAGENGLSLGPCMGVADGTSFGKNVTAYTVIGE